MWTIFIVQLVGLISPGPDFFYVSRKAMGESRYNAILAGIGITIGVGLWALIVLFGLAFLNQVQPSFQYILMLFGGSYLVFSGIKMVRSATNTKINATRTKPVHHSAWKEILGGLAINLSNPKIIVFFSSVLASYVSNLDNLSDILLVLCILMGSALVYFTLIAILLSHQRVRHFYAKNGHYLDSIAGIVFLSFGMSLVYEAIRDLL